jgi:hypothetical protein
MSMGRKDRLQLCWIAMAAAGAVIFAPSSDAQDCMPTGSRLEVELAAALNARDLDKAGGLIAEARPSARAPLPETPERYQALTPPRQSEPPVGRAASVFVEQVEGLSWWTREPPPVPSDIPAPLRAPAQAIRGLLAVAAIYPEQEQRATLMAIGAGDYLIQASNDAHFDGAPFPYWRGKPGRLGELSERMALRLERCGQLEQAVRGGWFVVEATPWEYFFDTGLVGEAYVALHEKTREPRFLAAALTAATWADRQPIAINWNYNAFLAGFFAELYRVSGDKRWLDSAVDRIRFGVLPGMIGAGEDAGHWVDPHNERIAYRAIMARALVQVSSALALASQEADRSSHASDIEQAAQTTIAALERQMSRANGVTSVSAMADLYAGIEHARASGARLDSTDGELRDAILRMTVEGIVTARLAPDGGAGAAIVLLQANAQDGK